MLFIITVHSFGQSGIASRYHGDIGIQKDSNVVFTEMFEEPDITSVIANWTDYKDSVQMELIDDVPAGSGGKTAIRLITVGNKINAVDLYKKLQPGINDSLF